MQLLTINEAAAQSVKSIQTIRRMIKQKKIQVKRQKTPQGFNYLIIKESLDEFLNKTNQTITRETASIQTDGREHRPIQDDFQNIFREEMNKFNLTIQQLTAQHAKDKENFFGLIKTFQERVMELENQIKMLEAPKGKWWEFWK